MEKAAKGITPAEEIMVTTEEIVAEAKEEAIEAPSKLREIWERASTRFLQAPKNRTWPSALDEAIARESRPPIS